MPIYVVKYDERTEVTENNFSQPAGPPNARGRFWSAIEAGELVVMPGVYDALSATLVQASGFSGAYMSGAAVSMSLIGYPDLGFATLTELALQVARITSVVDIPVLADADTGFGNALNVQRTVTEYERAGAAAIHLEDQVFPKRCGHLDGKSVIPSNEFAEKIRAAVEARRDPNFRIIARTDALQSLGYDEAVRRANLYAEAGADLIFVEAPQSVAEIARIPNDVRAPVLFNKVPGGRSQDVTYDELSGWGYSVVILPALLIRVVVEAINRALTGAGAPTPPQEATIEGGAASLFAYVGFEEWMRRSARFAL